MAKRVAGSQMTQDNWNEEEEPEDPGIFKVATDNVIKERKILKGRRKLADGSAGGEGGSSGAFSGFGGFGAKSSSTGKTGLFSFGGGATKPLSGVANGSETKPSAGFKMPPLQANESGNDSKDNKESKNNDSSKTRSASNGVSKPSESKYLQRLQCLNESVAKWIKQHVDKNPHCILTPIFKDYDKFLAEIEPEASKNGETTAEEEEEASPPSSETKKTAETAKPAVSSSFSFGSTASTSTTSSSSGTSLFSFGAAKSPPSFPSTTTSTSGTSVFGAGGAAASSGGTGFSFGGGSTTTTPGLKPFSFATGGASSQASSGGNQQAGGDEEEYVPPKAEVSEIKEDDAHYTKRCKMYYNKDGTWVEKGVGNLHLKPCGEKTQLLIRADTNLGNILLNIMLSSQMPFVRQGKNNVQFICIPHPPLEKGDAGAKATSILLRVKTGEDADELLENIKKHMGE